MSQAYHGGSSVRDGQQRQLSASSFREFVDRYINVPNVLKITRSAFHKLSKRDRGLRKDGPFFTACTFTEEAGKRGDETADQLTLIALDLDFPSDEDREKGYLDFAERFCESPETLSEQLYPFNFVAYETASSLPGARCLRIVVDTEESDLGLHKSYVTFVAKKLGILMTKWKGARESQVLSQPMYRPVQYGGEESVAVLCSRTNGEQLSELDIPNDILDEVETTYAYQAEGLTGGLLTHMPLHDISVEDVTEALESIDPDCDYREWTMVASGLRHQFRDEESAREAFHLFDAWSSEGKKYQGEKETLAKWGSFKPEAKGKVPITIRSVLKKAIDAGWNHKPLLNKVKQSITEWIDACEDEDELMNEGATRVASLPFRNAIVEESLAARLKARLSKISGVAVDKRTVARAIRAARREQVQNAESDNLEPWLRPWVFVSGLNVFHHHVSGIQLSPAAFDNTFGVKLMPKPSEGEDDASGRPSVMPTQYALNLKKIIRVDGVAYDPIARGEEPYLKLQGGVYLNTYSTREIPEEDPDNAELALRIFKAHLAILIKETNLQEAFLHFIAFAIQNPGALVRWAPFIQSAQGAGKSILVDILRGQVGGSNIKVVSPKAMSSNFNDWGFDTQFLIAEEMHAPGTGQRRQETMNAMKDIISNDYVTKIQKFKDCSISKNTSAKLCFSNNRDALQLEDSDRRYMPILSPLQTKRQILDLVATGHFDELARLKDELAGGLRSALMNLKIPKNFPVDGPAPDTPYRQEIIQESKNILHVEIEDLVADPSEPMVGEEVICTYQLNLALVNTRNNFRPSHYLYLMGYVPYENGKTFNIGGNRTTIWVHTDKYDPDLDAADDILKDILEET